MIRRATTWMLLACYGVIALAGQGLHAWMHEHGEDHCQEQPASVVSMQMVGSAAEAGGAIVSVPSDNDGCQHDPEHCAICQHHSLGQIFVATPPVEVALDVCEFLSTSAPDAVVCQAQFSPAQPRAPPIA